MDEKKTCTTTVKREPENAKFEFYGHDLVRMAKEDLKNIEPPEVKNVLKNLIVAVDFLYQLEEQRINFDINNLR